MADTSLVFNIVAKDRASGTFDKLKRNAALLGAAVGAMALKFGKDSVGAFVEAEQAQARLSAAFQKFPALSDGSMGALQRLNSELAKKTRFDDDATASGQAVLAQFRLTGKQIEQLTPLMQDYAAKTGKDLPTAAQDLGKAILGQGRALKAIGVNFTDTGSAAGNFTQLQSALNAQVGGFAAREGKTAAGQAAILSNQFGELQESVGSKLVPVLMKLADGMLGVIEFTQRHSTATKVLVGVAAAAATTIGVLTAASKVHALVLALQTEGTFAFAVAQKAQAVGAKIAAAAQWAWNAALTANPIGIVVVAIAALVGAIVLAYQKSETFRNVVQGAFRGVVDAGQKMWDILSGVFRFVTNAWLTVAGTILDGAAKAFGWVPGIGGKLEAAAAKFGEFRDSVNAALGGVKDNVTVAARIKGGQDAINEIARLRWELDRVPREVTVGVINKISRIPAYASGTSHHPGGLAWVGERGPELVSLPAGSAVHTASESARLMGTVAGAGAGGTVVVNLTVQGSVMSEVDLARKVRDAINDQRRRRGEGPL